MYLIYKICKYHKLLKQSLPQYSIDGSKNIWIVKPSYNARGFGIYLVDSLKDLLQSGKKGQQKIVQKYIERPFLLKIRKDQAPENPQLSKSPRNLQYSLRKFDIRQWVMVTSIEPLIIFTFSDFYLRICGSEFNLDDINDSYKHLSNYTIQKKAASSQDDLAMSQAQFKEYLKQNFDHSIDYVGKIRAQMNEMIIKTFQSA